MRRVFRFLTIYLVALASADARAAAPTLAPLLARGGLSVQRGEGRVNGAALDVAVVTGFADAADLETKLRESYAGTATVTVAPTEAGVVVMIADVRSPQCPACRAPKTAADVDEIRRGTLALSIMTFPGLPPIAFASPVGALLEPRAAPRRLVYEGEALASLRDDLDVRAQSAFVFGRASVATTLVAGAGAGDARALVERAKESLEKEGWRPVAAGEAREPGLGASFAAPAASVWSKDGRTVGLTVDQSEVMIHETRIR